MISELCNDVVDFSTLEIPKAIFTATFVRHLMLGTEETKKPDPWIRGYASRHPDLIPWIEGRQTGDSNVYSAGAKTYVTNLKNSLKTNFLRRLKKFLRQLQDHHGLDDGQRVGMLFEIQGWKQTPNVAKAYRKTPLTINTVIQHRRILGLAAPKSKIGKKSFDSAKNLCGVLRYACFANRWKRDHDLPMFDVVPICKIKAHFVTIDANVLHGVMKSVGVTDASRRAFRANVDSHWKRVLDYERLRGKHNRFTGTIQSDGVSVCVHFKRPKNDPDEFREDTRSFADKLCPGDRVVAVDPGRVNIVYAVEMFPDRPKVYRLTRGQYYAESGVNAANVQTKRWLAGVKKSADAFSGVSTKGVSTEDHEAYMAVHDEHAQTIWDENLKPRWARQRLRLYGGKKRVFARFLDRIVRVDPGRRVVVAYGAAGFAPGGKGERSVPTTRAQKEFAHRFRTEFVDEFRTSKMCHFDDSGLERIKVRGSGRKWCLRGLLWCGSTDNSKFVNRDFNAAMNIHRCAVSAVRPECLTRKRDLPRFVDRVGKVIKNCRTTRRKPPPSAHHCGEATYDRGMITDEGLEGIVRDPR